MLRLRRVLVMLAAAPAIAASQVSTSGGKDEECFVRFGSPLTMYFEGHRPQAMQDVIDVDLKEGWIGSPDARIKMKACDRAAWHCIELPGAPLFLPRPYVPSRTGWSVGAMTYQVGEPFLLRYPARMHVTPVFAFDRVDGAGVSPQMLRAVFLFDPGMSLVGYGAQSLQETQPYYDMRMNWIVEGVASIECL